MHTKSSSVLLAGIAWTLAMSACTLFGPTHEEVIGKYRSQYAQMRADLKAIAKILPVYRKDQAPLLPLNPAPNYRQEGGEAVNTDILMYEHLLDPDADLDDPEHCELYLTAFLRNYLQWTGPKNPMDPSVLRSRTTSFSKELQSGLQLKYLGIARVVKYQSPKVLKDESPDASDETKYSGGTVSIAGYLVDLPSKQVLCVFGLSAKTADSVETSVNEGEDAKAALESAARSTMTTAARQKFVEAAQKTCGGSFVLRP